MKLILQGETKRIRDPESLAELVKTTREAFDLAHTQAMKYFYQDTDGDIISVSSAYDFNEML